MERSRGKYDREERHKKERKEGVGNRKKDTEEENLEK